MAVISIVPFLVARHMVDSEDHQALQTQADNTRTSISNLIGNVRTSVRTLAAGLDSSPSPAVFKQNAAPLVQAGGNSAVALINTQTSPPSVIDVEGPAKNVAVGQALPTQVTDALRDLNPARPFTSTAVMNSGGSRQIAFLDAAPEAPPGTAVYYELVLSSFDSTTSGTIFGVSQNTQSAMYASKRKTRRRFSTRQHRSYL